MIKRVALLSLLSAVPSMVLAGVEAGYTAPNKKAEIAMPILGVVKEIAVVEGQKVKKGDLLLKQDDAGDQAELRGYELRADVTIDVAQRQADYELKKLQYERLKSINDQGGGSANEVQEAQTNMKIAELAIDKQKHDGVVANAQADSQRERIRLKTLLAPFDGVIEQIAAVEGESTDPQKPSLVLVQLDPLNVEVPGLSPEQVEKLQVGQVIPVRYPGETTWTDAKIKYIAPVVDATADTQLIKLELPNPKGTYGGKKVDVKLPDVSRAVAADSR